MLKVNPEERLSIAEAVRQLQEIAAARNVNPKAPITEVRPDICADPACIEGSEVCVLSITLRSPQLVGPATALGKSSAWATPEGCSDSSPKVLALDAAVHEVF